MGEKHDRIIDMAGELKAMGYTNGLCLPCPAVTEEKPEGATVAKCKSCKIAVWVSGDFHKYAARGAMVYCVPCLKAEAGER